MSKSYVASLYIVVNFLRGLRVIALAQNFKALNEVLFMEIRARLDEMEIDYHFERQNMKITYGKGVIFGASYENLESIRGLSRISVAVCDEAALSPNTLFSSLSPCLRGEGIEPYIRLLSTPRKGSWLNMYIKDHPETVEVIQAKTSDNPLITEEQLQLMKQSMVNRDILQQELDGVMLDIDSDSSIVRYRDFIKDKRDSAKQKWLGSDMAGLGADSNAYVVIDKFGVVEYKTIQEQDTFQKTDTINSLWDSHSVISGCIDATGGYGQGAEDLLKQRGRDILGVNFADKATDPDKYPNVRTQMYLELAEEVKNGFWIPEEARAELLAQSVTINNKGKLALIPKADIKKVLGHSPDLCDAIALSVFAMRHGSELSKKNEEEDASQSLNDYLWWHEVMS